MSFGEYRPHGESLTFTRIFGSDVESSEILFADALRACDHLAAVVRPAGFDLRFACAIDGTFIKVNDPEPSEQYWEILRQGSPTSGNEPPPSVVKRLSSLSDTELKATYRQALETITCPPGFFVIFESITPLKTATRLADSSVAAGARTVLVDLWDDRVELAVVADSDGTRWLGPLPEGAPYLPPISFSISYETILVLTVDVNWGRWLEAGTEEHALLRSVSDALVADDWQPQG